MRTRGETVCPKDSGMLWELFCPSKKYWMKPQVRQPQKTGSMLSISGILKTKLEKVKEKLFTLTRGEEVQRNPPLSLFNPSSSGHHSEETLLGHQLGGPDLSTLRKLRPTIRDYMWKPGQPNTLRLKGSNIVSKSQAVFRQVETWS